MTPHMTLRPVSIEDARLIFNWANDPEDRASSFDQSVISWTDHISWFSEKIASQTVYFFVAEDSDGHALGQIRLEIDGDTVHVASIGIAPEWRGRGYGSALILAAADELARRGYAEYWAVILSSNSASKKAFLRAGFALSEMEAAPDDAVRMTMIHECPKGWGGWVGW